VWNSRDHALATVLDIADFVFTTFVGQIAYMITGIGKVGKVFGKLAL
jgi:hypothetical protein